MGANDGMFNATHVELNSEVFPGIITKVIMKESSNEARVDCSGAVQLYSDVL